MERVGNPYVRGGGGGGGGELKLGGIEADFIEIICRQVLGGCLKLSASFAKSKEFLPLYHKTQCILNIESIFKANVEIVGKPYVGGEEDEGDGDDINR